MRDRSNAPLCPCDRATKETWRMTRGVFDADTHCALAPRKLVIHRCGRISVCVATVRFSFRCLRRRRRSPLLVRVEDVVLALHRHMTCVPAVGFGLVGGHLAGRSVMVEERVSPTP